MIDPAAVLRAQIPSSTDPARLERLAREAEQREGKTMDATEAPAVEAEVIAPPPEPKPWEAIPDGDFGIVELYGHQRLVGRVAEVDRFGTKMLAIAPLFNGVELATVYHGGGSIYRFSPCNRETAWRFMPRQDYSLPEAIRALVPPTALPAPATADPPSNGDPWDDDEDERDDE